MLNAAQTEPELTFETAANSRAWPAVMSKAEYGRYRRTVSGRGSPAAVTLWIGQGKIAGAALTQDGKINRALADSQLAAATNPAAIPSRSAPRPAARASAPDAAPAAREIAADDTPPEVEAALAGNTDYAASKAELVREQVRAARMANDLREGRLVEITAVQIATMDAARATRDRILTVPDAISGVLVGKTEREIASLLRGALRDALKSMVAEGVGDAG